MFTSLFWKDTLERAISTAIQVVIGLLTVDGVDLANLDFKATAVAAGTAALLAVFKAIVAARTVDDSVSPASLASEKV